MLQQFSGLLSITVDLVSTIVEMIMIAIVVI